MRLSQMLLLLVLLSLTPSVAAAACPPGEDCPDPTAARREVAELGRRIDGGRYLFVQGTVLYLAASAFHISQEPLLGVAEPPGMVGFYGAALAVGLPWWGASLGVIGQGIRRAGLARQRLGGGEFRLRGQERIGGLTAAAVGLYGAGLASAAIASAAWGSYLYGSAASPTAAGAQEEYEQNHGPAVVFGMVVPGLLAMGAAVPLSLLFHHLLGELGRARSELGYLVEREDRPRTRPPLRLVSIGGWSSPQEGTQGVIATFSW